MFKVASSNSEFPISRWYEYYQNGRIELHPPYQRRSGIWSAWKQAHLIDSIINDFDIPKFYFADFTRFPDSKLNTSKKPYAVIDGKQRLQAIFDYLDDKFPLNPSSHYEDRDGADVGKLLYSELRNRFPDAADKILNFVPSIIHVVTDEPDRVEEMFVRLNSGEHITGAEKRNSMAGPIPQVIRELSVHPFFVRKIKFAIKRMQDLNLIAKLLLLEERGKFSDTKKNNLDELARSAVHAYQAASKDKGETKRLNEHYIDLQQRVFDVLDLMANVFKDKDTLLANQGSIPVYYWFVKKVDRAQLVHVREFLVYMTAAVKNARKFQITEPEKANQQLTLYYTLGRTTNDGASLSHRFEILMQRFAMWQRGDIDW